MLVTLTTLSGTIFGYLLALNSPEELEPGKKYFKLGERVLGVLSFLPFFAYAFFFGDLVLLSILAFTLLFASFITFGLRFILFTVAFAIMLLSVQGNYLIVQSALIFFYCLFAGTLLRILRLGNL